jgi:hypothetical protein
MAIRASALCILAALALSGAGCGGGDDPSPEAEARAAVADYMDDALFDADAEAACDRLTAEGQAQLVTAVKKLFPHHPRPEDCVEALTNLYGEAEFPNADTPIPTIERIRSGEEGRMVITGDTGVLIAAPGPKGLRVAVEEVDGEWLVSNGTEPLFSFGVDPSGRGTLRG